MDDTTSNNERPLRAGKKWTSEENERLMQRVMKGRTIEDIAKKHHRTTNAIRLRIFDNALQMVHNGCTIDDICKKLFLVKDELETHIAKRTFDDKLKTNTGTPVNQKSNKKEGVCEMCKLLHQQLQEKDKHITWLLTQVSQQPQPKCEEVSLIDL